METPQRLLLIDGSGFIFRAYHKLPPLTRADGTPTGAVYGFTTMLMKLRDELSASHAVVVFDAASKTFRNEIYSEYKANRPPPPEDLIPQFPLVREAAKALNLPVVEQLGAEADDVIATYAVQAKKQGLEVCIVSSDKDLMQLMAKGITLYDPMKSKPITLEDVEAKFGVPPEQVIEVQALMGDSIDNIPGVKGIGAKTAALLIQQFGSVEALLERVNEIPQPKRRELLEASKEQLLLSKRLVTLKDNCENLPDLADYTVKPLDAEKFIAFCQEQGFKSIAKRIAEKHQLAVPATSPALIPAILPEVNHNRSYHLVQEMAALEALLQRIRAKGVVAVDTETTSLDATKAELVGISLALEAGEAYYIPLAHKSGKAGAAQDLFSDGSSLLTGQIPLQQALAALMPILQDPAILKIGHNIKYDALVLHKLGITLAPVEDTMLISYCLGAGAGNHNMDELAETHLGITPIAFKDVTGSGKSQITFDYVPLEQARDYAAEDADITLQLYQRLKPQLAERGLLAVYERMERALIPVIVQMEAHGVKVELSTLERLSNRFATELHRLEQEIHQLAGHPFNIGSPKQLGEVLFDELQLAKGKKSGKTGAYVTDAETLEELALIGHELPAKVLNWRQLSKLKSTYTDALVKQIHPDTKRVHTSYSLAATSTGRLSSSDPNLQNIPIRTEEGRQIRSAFVPDAGFTMMSADYSQIELRLLAHMADIAPLKQAFKENKDIHTITAAQMFGVAEDAVDSELRRKAKTINFGIIYGISAHGLATRLGIPRGQAAEYIDAYFKQYGGIKDYMERTKQLAREQGYVTTLWGRRCHTPMIHEKNPNRRAFAERAAINAPLQGSAADIIKRAMIAVHQHLQREQAKSRMLLQVHDELVFEIAAGEEALIPQIKRIMEQVAHLDVPLVVETGTGSHWGEAH